jgi:cysteine-rich repeat protein
VLVGIAGVSTPAQAVRTVDLWARAVSAPSGGYDTNYPVGYANFRVGSACPDGGVADARCYCHCDAQDPCSGSSNRHTRSLQEDPTEYLRATTFRDASNQSIVIGSGEKVVSVKVNPLIRFDEGGSNPHQFINVRLPGVTGQVGTSDDWSHGLQSGPNPPPYSGNGEYFCNWPRWQGDMAGAEYAQFDSSWTASDLTNLVVEIRSNQDNAGAIEELRVKAVRVRVTIDQCGNGSVDANEQCDDGNTSNGDCCSATCQNESPGAACGDDGNACTTDVCSGAGSCVHGPNAAACDDGLFCNGSDVCSGGICAHAGNPCSDGSECVNVCNETTDTCVVSAGAACSSDGNVCTTDACDGVGACSHLPNVDPCDDGDACTQGDHCAGGACLPGTIADECPTCDHDGRIDPGEECDDGNTEPGDGCSPTCTCDSTSCGDGRAVPGCGEECDLGPGNCAPGLCCESGCDSHCMVIGICSGSHACCHQATDCSAGEGCCGDATLDVGEQCDDGNVHDGDCCDASCHVETSDACTPSACVNFFGPHRVQTANKATFFDANLLGGVERWVDKVQGILAFGQAIDPQFETVRVSFSENRGTGTANSRFEVYAATLVPGGCPPLTSCFAAKDLNRTRFKFYSRSANIPGACGLNRISIVRRGAIVKLAMKGSDLRTCPYDFRSITKPRVRADLIIGDDCFTTVLTCSSLAGGKKVKCVSSP